METKLKILFFTFLNLILINALGQTASDMANQADRESKKRQAVMQSELQDMLDISESFYKKIDEIIQSKIKKCYESPKNNINSKYSEMLNYLESSNQSITDDIERQKASIDQKFEIAKSNHSAACYPGSNNDLKSYLNCLEAIEKNNSIANIKLNSRLLGLNYSIIDNDIKSYISCSMKFGIEEESLDKVIGAIKLSGDFYGERLKSLAKLSLIYSR